jgi:G3E family GTPase
MIKLDLITGFLGAGKTTFIKELLKRTDKKPVIMENEYGANNLDSLELQNASSKSGEIKILEFMEGCVCCTMKDSFVNSVFAIYSSLEPEYLIIEPTGVGKLSNIINNLKPLLKEDISLLKPCVVISPEGYEENMRQWQTLYEDQIKNAQTVIFSKCENTDPDILESVSGKVRALNPDADIISRHYTTMDLSWWNSLLDIGADELSSDSGDGASGDDISFSEVSITEGGLHNAGELIVFLEDCLHGEFGKVARAKGTLWVDTEFVRFDLADRMYIISGSPDDKCQCVVIGQGLDEKKIRSRLCPGRKSLKI